MSKRALLAFAAVAVLGCEADTLKPKPKPNPNAKSASELIQQLATAYQNRDYNAYAALLSNEPDAEFLYVLSEPTFDGETQWGRNEELRIHQRMFRPQDTPATEPPVPPENWLVSITVHLTSQQEFSLSTRIYRPPLGDNPDGLDGTRWKATEAIYEATALWDLQGQTDYFIDHEAQNFVVIEDLTKQVGDEGKFLLYRWMDLGTRGKTGALESRSWSAVKSLYK